MFLSTSTPIEPVPGLQVLPDRHVRLDGARINRKNRQRPRGSQVLIGTIQPLPFFILLFNRFPYGRLSYPWFPHI